MNNNALIGVLAAISGRDLRRNERTQALVAALSMGSENALAGYLVGQSAVERNARQQAQQEAREQRQRAEELDQRDQTAQALARRCANLSDDERSTLERLLGQEWNQFLEAHRHQEQENEQRSQQQRNYPHSRNAVAA